MRARRDREERSGILTHDWVDRAARQKLEVYNVIDGARRQGSGAEQIAKLSPRDGAALYSFPVGAPCDVDAAVSSARTALADGPWRDFTVGRRKRVLSRLIDLIGQHAETFALYECLDVGKPIRTALVDDVQRAIAKIRPCIEGADKVWSPSGTDGGAFCYQRRKPVGVIGAIVGWNYPLGLATGRIAPALVMGNSIVLKPSEFTGLSTCLLAQLALEAGVPPGVFNVVNGAGATVGDALARHDDVGLLSFVGSSATGKKLMEAAAQSNMKRLILECGGKSPMIVFEDCWRDLDALAARIVAQAFPNQGALCIAGTRLLIDEGLQDALLPRIVDLAEAIEPGDPLDPETSFGAIINEEHLSKVRGFIERAERDGARRLCGGERVLEQTGGCYLTPAILDRVGPSMELNRQEVFGPVLTVQTFADEAEAVRLANDVRYGLAAHVYTRDVPRCQRLGRDLDVGLLQILPSAEPSGGGVSVSVQPHKESGFGHGGGLEGLAAHTVTTSVVMAT